MEGSKYESGQFGRPAREPGKAWSFTYYQPNPLPRQLDLAPPTVLALSEADAALGLLNGLGQLIHDPEVLLGPFLTREALASSRIEGTNATLTDVLQAQATPDDERRDDGVAEVRRYLAATREGIELAQHLPITQRLICRTHLMLMTGVRGEEKLPGELRRTPVWVGASNATPDTAAFVPPLPHLLPALLSDWEDFVNTPVSLPVLIKCALMHYQFETIHPFLDGNGRIGRLLVGLLLQQEGRLTKPLLYLSGYLEANRAEYYARLQAVREIGDIDAYLQFFLEAVTSQAADAVSRARRLVSLREAYSQQCRLDRSSVAGIIPLIFSTPFVTTRRVQESLGITDQGARNLLARAQRLGWLLPLHSVGRGGATLWFAREVFDIIDAPLEYAPTE